MKKENYTEDTVYLIHDLRTDKPQPVIFGLLLLPFLSLLILHWLPLGAVIIMSFRKTGFPGMSEFTGFRNYRMLLSDAAFAKAWLNMLKMTVLSPNFLLIILSPLATAVLFLKLRRTPAAFFKTAACLVFPAASVMLTAFLLKWFFSPGIGGAGINLADPPKALKGLEMTYLVTGLGFSVPIGVFLYLAVLKGAPFTPNSNNDDRNTWSLLWKIVLVYFLVYFAFAIQEFIPGYILTRGGPSGKTMLPSLKTYIDGFQRMNFGYAATQQALLVILLLILGFFFWLLVEKSGVRIWVSDKTAANGKILDGMKGVVVLAVSAAIVLILLFVIVRFLVVPPLALLSKTGPGFGAVIRTVRANNTFKTGMMNSMSIYLPVLWIQAGFSCMAGYALGRFRFPGRRVLFAMVCITALAAPGIKAVPLYSGFMSVGLMNTRFAAIAALIPSPLAIVLFKLYFEGFRIEYARSREENDISEKRKIRAGMFRNTVFMSLLVIIVIAVIDMGGIMIHLSLLQDSGKFPLGVMNLMIDGQYTGNHLYVLVYSVLAAFPVVFGVLILAFVQIFFSYDIKMVKLKN